MIDVLGNDDYCFPKIPPRTVFCSYKYFLLLKNKYRTRNVYADRNCPDEEIHYFDNKSKHHTMFFGEIGIWDMVYDEDNFPTFFIQKVWPRKKDE